MKKFSVIGQLFLAAALFIAARPCQAELPRQQGNRFLFVVDTAAAMRGYSNEVVDGVVELLSSDMRGEFRPGDTIGLWTYNDTLHPEFPMQIWSKEDKSIIVADMAAFLQERRYQKRAHFETVMPVLNQVIKNSERITVILIFDGSGLIQGTPFDKDINDLQKKYARELRAAHRPFVTVLAARDGAVFDYTINYPGLVAIPHTANPEEPAEPIAPVAAVSTPAPVVPEQPRFFRSFILSRPAIVHPAAPAPVIVPAPPVAAAPAPAPRPVAPKPLPVVPIVAAPAPLPVVPPAAPAPLQTQPAPPPVVARQNPPPVSVAVNNQPPPAQPVAQNALAAGIPPAGNTQVALFVVAISLLTIAVGLVVFLIRRSRGPSQPSLITQSINRPR